MPIIDDEGRLFGTVNIIDALVVLFILALVVAGFALVFGGPTSEPATRYATVDLGTHPGFVAEQVSPGDQLAEDAEGNLTVTDVYYTPGSDGQVRVIARMELQGSISDGSETFQYAGQPLQQGSDVNIRTPDYEVAGTITRLDQNGTTLRTAETPVRLTTTLSAESAATIAAGDTVTVANREVATIDAVEVAPTGDPTQRHVTVGATLQTYAGDGSQR
jgi:hypothetical protein